MGARRIFAFDIDNSRLDIAKEYGADICINTMDDNFREEIKEHTRGRGFEMVIETGCRIYRKNYAWRSLPIKEM